MKKPTIALKARPARRLGDPGPPLDPRPLDDASPQVLPVSNIVTDRSHPCQGVGSGPGETRYLGRWLEDDGWRSDTSPRPNCGDCTRPLSQEGVSRCWCRHH